MSFRIIPRSEWGARYGRGSDVTSRLPWGEVVIHTEAGAVRAGDWPAVTEAARTMSLTEKQHVQAVERYHSVTLGWQGVGYSFLISRDGSIFEGRGWGRSGSHTETRNSTAAGICFLGHGDIQPATGAQWAAAEWLIREGIRLGKIRSNYKVSGHRDYSRKGKTCPGNLIYPYIQRLGGLTRPAAVEPTKPIETPKKTGELSMSDINIILDRLDKIDKELGKLARKAAVVRDKRDGKVWVLTSEGRYHLPNPGHQAVSVMAFIGLIDFQNPIPEVDAGVLDLIPVMTAPPLVS